MEIVTVYLRKNEKKENLISYLKNASWGENFHQKIATDESEPIFLSGYRHPYLWLLSDSSGHIILGIPDLGARDRVDIVADCDVRVRKQLINVVANVFRAPIFSTRTIQ